jgi:AcrR family transcriptional regulator
MTTLREPNSGTTVRRNRDAEIVDAAISVFSQKGYSAASLQDIADRVGILKGSLYHYISSKESLLFRILVGSHDAAKEVMASVDSQNLPAEEKFVAYVTALSLWYLQHLERGSLYLNEWRYLQGDYGKTVRAQRRAFNQYMRTIIEDSVRQGLASPDLDADLATKFIISAIDSIPGWYRANLPNDLEATAAAIAVVAHSTVFPTRR